MNFMCVCGAQVVAPDGSEGKKARCPACKRVLTIDKERDSKGRVTATPERQRILIVEDDADLAAIVRELLEVEGYEVLVAYDGSTGLDMVYEKAPDLVVLDLMLPQINGFEVCRKIKDPANVANKNCWRTPVIILSARSKDRDVRYGKAVGADAYLQKPFKTTELSETIGKLLEKKAVE